MSEFPASEQPSNERDLIERARRQIEALPARRKEPSLPRGHRAAIAPDTLIGDHRLVRELQRGGQGVVYLAIQAGTKRQVAIKFLRDGPFPTQSEQARFQREIEILASLSHPNIVSIHGTGTIAGNLYLVMDYVEGWPLDEYVRERLLNSGPTAGRPVIRSIVELFAKVCDALGTAHTRGIIHRDVKPSNVIVDETGEPHVLDFGLAKVVREQSPNSSDLTLTGQFVGTLPWSSPEQALGDSDLDTRTDVYAIGLLLYQALAQRPPYSLQGGPAQLIEAIAHAEPAPLRRSNPQIDDDLETIVLKCLRKERDQRYETAGDLARDLRRYLAAEPIQAKRASLVYVLRKRFQRNRLQALLAGGLGVAILGGLVSSLILWQAAAAERDRAVIAGRETLAALDAEQERAAELAALVRLLDDMLSSVDRTRYGGREATLREALDFAAERLASGQMSSEPRVRANVLTKVASAYSTLGRYADAARHASEAARIHREQTGDTKQHAAALLQTGIALRFDGRAAEAEPPIQESLTLIARPGVGSATEIAATRQELAYTYLALGRADEALREINEALAVIQAAPPGNDSTRASLLSTLGEVLGDRGQWQEARAAIEEALALRRAAGSDPRDISKTASRLAQLLSERGEVDEALPALREARDLALAAYGPDHPETASSVNNLALALYRVRRLDEAEPLFRDAIRIQRATLGLRHPNLLNSSSNLAALLIAAGKQAEAAVAYAELYEVAREQLGEDHPTTATILNNRSTAQRKSGDLEGAEQSARAALAIRREKLGPDHPEVGVTLNNLALACKARGLLPEAEVQLREALRIHTAADPEHRNTATMMGNLAELLLAQADADPAEAQELAEKAVVIFERQLGTDHVTTQGCRKILERAREAVAARDTAAP